MRKGSGGTAARGASAGNRRLRVRFFGTYDADAHPRVAVLFEGLSALGAEVTEQNAPLGIGTAARVDMLHRPWTAHRLLRRLLRSWIRLARRRGTPPDAVVVGHLGHFDVVLARCVFPRARVALDYLVGGEETAIDRRAAPGSIAVRLLRGLDRLALATASVPVVDTADRLPGLPPRSRRRAVVVPVGATEAWHRVAPTTDGLPLRVVFFGLFTPLHGSTTIARAAALLRDRTDLVFTFVGSGQESAAARALAPPGERMTWRTWCPAGELPQLVAGHHVCLGIFGTTEKARRVVPNKVYQGAAAGCAVVTSDTRPQRAALGDAGVYVPAADAEGLAAALSHLAECPAELTAAREAARDRARRAFAPAVVAEPLYRALT